jgi:hypothetical protein
MKKAIWIMLVVLLVTGSAWANDFTLIKKADDLTVIIKIDKNPPVVGDNNMVIWLKDAASNDVKGAIMTVDYGKHTMFWIFERKYNSWAQPHENNYHAILKIPTQGSWDVTINITNKGNKVSTKFRIDVK